MIRRTYKEWLDELAELIAQRIESEWSKGNFARFQIIAQRAIGQTWGKVDVVPASEPVHAPWLIVGYRASDMHIKPSMPAAAIRTQARNVLRVAPIIADVDDSAEPPVAQLEGAGGPIIAAR